MPLNRTIVSLAIGLVALEVSVMAQPAVAADEVCQAQILQSYPHGAWLENMAQDAAGRLYFTILSDRKIEVFEPGKGVKHFADLPIYPLGIVILKDRLVVAGNRRRASEGPEALRTNAVVEVSLAGEVGRVTDLPDAKMLNGAVLDPGGSVLIADTLGGKIWRYDPISGAVSIWLADELLAPPPAVPAGANGLKILGSELLVSNSGRGEILKIGISANGAPVGKLSTLYKTGPVDDFDVETDGTVIAAPLIVAPSSKSNIMRISPQGEIDTVLPSGAEGSTAVSLIGGRDRPTAFYVTTNGGMLFGGKYPAKLLRVLMPGPKGCAAISAK